MAKCQIIFNYVVIQSIQSQNNIANFITSNYVTIYNVRNNFELRKKTYLKYHLKLIVFKELQIRGKIVDYLRGKINYHQWKNVDTGQAVRGYTVVIFEHL